VLHVWLTVAGGWESEVRAAGATFAATTADEGPPRDNSNQNVMVAAPTMAMTITRSSRRGTPESELTARDGALGGDAGAATWTAAHFSHCSQTVADSGMSLPHAAQRFTRVTPADSCSRTHREWVAKRARPVPRATESRGPWEPAPEPQKGQRTGGLRRRPEKGTDAEGAEATSQTARKWHPPDNSVSPELHGFASPPQPHLFIEP
jgi:hypothetical protein